MDKEELKQKLQYWKDRALTDSLTGLRNREALEEDLASEAAASFVMVDVDDFKEINDTKGHEHGDKVLKEVAAKLETVAQDKTTAYRYGGEEFLIVVYDQKRVASRAVDIIDAETEVTISAGTGATISEADQALYKAKNSGKNTFVTH